MKLNRTVVFWTALVSGIVMLAQQVGSLFGFVISDHMTAEVMAIASTVLSLLVLVGVLTNSEQAETFEAKVLKK